MDCMPGSICEEGMMIDTQLVHSFEHIGTTEEGEKWRVNLEVTHGEQTIVTDERKNWSYFVSKMEQDTYDSLPHINL